MPGKKKKFLDKKNAVTFHLVHRSQRDPLQADEDAPERVLLPTQQEQTEARKEEERKYGIFFDDDYDYLQHLKDVNELCNVEPLESFRTSQVGLEEEAPEHTQEPKLKLPSSVFASDIETEVGLLNKAAAVTGPQVDWDPDIVEAMDDDFDFDDPNNQLDDDFMALANADELHIPEPGINDQKEFLMDRLREYTGVYDTRERMGNEDEDDGFATDEAEQFSDAESDQGSVNHDPFAEEETKSRFTNYSMTSSVMHRNKGLALLDDRFEKMFEEYDDTEIGALDHEDIDGSVQPTGHMLTSIIEEFHEQQKQIKLKDTVEKAKNVEVGSDGEAEHEEIIQVEIEEPGEKWDCETVLSTYFNLYNHPKLIEEPKKTKPITLTKRLGIPGDSLPKKGLTLRQMEEQKAVTDKVVTYRPKGEDIKEKKARKMAVKEERQARRQQKKANKMAFKDEKIRQDKEVMNLQKNLQGIRMT